MTQLLEVTSDLFGALLEAAPDAMVIINQSGHIVLVNSQTHRMFGYAPAELLGKPVELLIPARFHGRHPAHRERYFGEPHFRPMGAGLELSGVRKDGGEFPVEVSLSPLRTPQGVLVTSAIRDISERKRFERELQEQNEQLRRARQASDGFLASMSHELRTPLNGIIGFAEFLADGKPGALNPKQKEYLQDILDSGRQLLQLINDVLDTVRLKSGKLELHETTFEVSQAIEEVRCAMTAAASSKRIELTTAIDPGLSRVSLDEQRFKQVVFHLLANAIKFTGEGGSVRIEARALDAGRFQLTVSDTGIGIDPHDLRRLFAEFEQLDTGIARRFDGAGLGLALTRGISRLLGGGVQAESEIGKGSRFSVLLPVAMSRSSTPRPESESASL